MTDATTPVSTIDRIREVLDELNVSGRIPHAVEGSAWIGLTTERDPSNGGMWAAVVVSGSPSATCHQCGQHAVFTGAPATLTQFGGEQPLDRQHGCGAWLESQWLLGMLDLDDPHAADVAFDTAADMAAEVDGMIAGDQRHDRDRIVGEIKATHARVIADLDAIDLNQDPGDVANDVMDAVGGGSEVDPGTYVEGYGRLDAVTTWDYDPASDGDTIAETTAVEDLSATARAALSVWTERQ